MKVKIIHNCLLVRSRGRFYDQVLQSNGFPFRAAFDFSRALVQTVGDDQISALSACDFDLSAGRTDFIRSVISLPLQTMAENRKTPLLRIKSLLQFYIIKTIRKLPSCTASWKRPPITKLLTLTQNWLDFREPFPLITFPSKMHWMKLRKKFTRSLFTGMKMIRIRIALHVRFLSMIWNRHARPAITAENLRMHVQNVKVRTSAPVTAKTPQFLSQRII